MRITDDRLDDLVDAFIERQADQRDFAAVILALTELQDRRDDEYEDADSNYETARDIVNPPYPDEDIDACRCDDCLDPDDGVSWDDEEAYLAGDGCLHPDPDDDRYSFVPPWDGNLDVAVDDDDAPF
jgi:hypothetical protein